VYSTARRAKKTFEGPQTGRGGRGGGGGGGDQGVWVRRGGGRGSRQQGQNSQPPRGPTGHKKFWRNKQSVIEAGRGGTAANQRMGAEPRREN